MLLSDALKCGKYSLASNIKTLKNKDNVLVLHSKDDHMVKYEYNTKKLLEKNPQLKSIILENKRHNPNYTVEAVQLLNKFSKDRTNLFKQKNLTKEDKEAFVSSYDWEKMTTQDNLIWEEIFNHLDK
jgi:hypothetical protein